jgi:hypothetical protein
VKPTTVSSELKAILAGGARVDFQDRLASYQAALSQMNSDDDKANIHANLTRLADTKEKLLSAMEQASRPIPRYQPTIWELLRRQGQPKALPQPQPQPSTNELANIDQSKISSIFQEVQAMLVAQNAAHWNTTSADGAFLPSSARTFGHGSA